MTASDARKAIQRILLVPADGVIGPRTRAAFDALSAVPGAAKWPLAPSSLNSGPSDASIRVDERSERNIATLHPKLQPIARKFIQTLAANGIEAKIISGTRSYAEQDAIYAQGRTKPGPIVTNARAGFSNHNFGTALDIGIFKNGKYLPESPLYRSASVFAKALGLSWGGDWKGSLQDEPHYSLAPPWSTGLSESEIIAQLRLRHNAGEDVFA